MTSTLSTTVTALDENALLDGVSDEEWPDDSDNSSVSSDDTAVLDALPIRQLSVDEPVKLCQSACKACEVVRSFERINDRDSDAWTFFQHNLPECTWTSRKAIRIDAEYCMLCSYLIERSSSAKSRVLKPRKKTFLRRDVRLSLVPNREIEQSNQGLERRFYDLQFEEEARYVTLAFCSHRDPRVHLGARRIEPLFDYAIGKLWLSRCSGHAVESNIMRESSTLSGSELLFRAIDTQSRCIREWRIDKKETQIPPYAALSYVWGLKPQLMLTKVNRTALSRDNAFSREERALPTTIYEALEVAARLGYQYLWVDALCIVQDDDGDKMQQISRMGSIYQDAGVTIVSTSESVHEGIPGMASSPRAAAQRAFQTPNYTLIDRTWGVDLSIDSSRWWQRGWTLQEYVLSQRLIVFTKYQAFFMCSAGVIWYEDELLGSHSHDSSIGSARYREVSNRPGGDRIDILGTVDQPTRRYERLLWVYQNRGLGFSSDNLNAFSGILATIGESLWGIPVPFFHSALCWTANLYTQRPDLDVTELQPVPGFPSWSWAAWKSESLYFEFMIADPMVDKARPMFSVGKDIDGRLLHRTVGCRECEASTCPKHLSRLEVLDAGLAADTEMSLSIAGSPPHSVLRFQASIYSLHVERNGDVALDGTTGIYRIYADNSMATVLTDVQIDPKWRRSAGDMMSFVEIGRCKSKSACLLVEQRDGIAYRRPSVAYLDLQKDVRLLQTPIETVTLA